MVVIRLARGGAKKAPFYHIVAADKRSARDGRYIEKLGYFNPSARGEATYIELKKERIDHWLGQGAQPSERVNYLVKFCTKADKNTVLASDAPKKVKKPKVIEALEAEAKAEAEPTEAKAEEKPAEAKAEEKPDADKKD